MHMLFILLLLLSSSSLSVTGNAELRALMEIKASLDPGNKRLSSWTADGDPCGGAFEGVACNEHRKVANISLQGKGLAGKVPAALSELKCLSGLYLHYNSLTGQIPPEIANLTELTDLYLNVNHLTGQIPPQIGSMASLQVVQLCCNNLTGNIPAEMGLLKKLSVLALENNGITGQIPSSLGNLGMLKRLYLNSNRLSGPVPIPLANLVSLQVLDVRNNTLSGAVPLALRHLNEEFRFENNPGLCGSGFPSLRACTAWDNANQASTVPAASIPRSAPLPLNCSHCSGSSSRLPQIGIVGGAIAVTLALTVVALLCAVKYRRAKQKVSHKSETSEDQLHKVMSHPSPREYGHEEASPCSKFNLEEVESATHHFSEANLLGRSKFSAVYRGTLKDGVVVAIKSISKSSCKTDEDEFFKGMSLLSSLNHENVVKLKGYCSSKARGECFLIYEFVPGGNLSHYLDGEDDHAILDWPTRVSIIHGIAKGMEYLHRNEWNKGGIIHQNISVEKVVLDEQMRPLIVDCGLLKLLADDVVYSALKVSAALGYMAPEYISTGRFTEKSDVYAYGVIILQVLSGKTVLSTAVRAAAESGNVGELMDMKLEGKYSESEGAGLTKLALDCTNDDPLSRPTMEWVVRELSSLLVESISNV
ncbi:probable LRR receptor-like serine/threonine-protein kinase At5g37450 [Salvia hispanica]|uniref:probable LRR receptor-like serine/threonine-protein kinase At5g37450 n=1 Tax=Salvia hispanica TaxID=49212 RepID=UPI0020093366|nr:probable LRR receptor-like serine/threonine-protein kinase At5g37450 [Salvia hispanica]